METVKTVFPMKDHKEMVKLVDQTNVVHSKNFKQMEHVKIVLSTQKRLKTNYHARQILALKQRSSLEMVPVKLVLLIQDKRLMERHVHLKIVKKDKSLNKMAYVKIAHPFM